MMRKMKMVKDGESYFLKSRRNMMVRRMGDNDSDDEDGERW